MHGFLLLAAGRVRPMRDHDGSASLAPGERSTARGELNSDNIITWALYDGEAETIVVNDGHDAFFHQIGVVERSLAAGVTEAPRPSPRLVDSLEIMELLTSWERCCLT